jgi:hypothetical protein
MAEPTERRCRSETRFTAPLQLPHSNHYTISSLSRFTAETRQSAAPLASAEGAGISTRNARWATIRLSVLCSVARSWTVHWLTAGVVSA